MRTLLIVILSVAVLLLSLMQFTSLTRVDDFRLVKAIQSELASQYRKETAQNFNQSLDTESLGRIFNRMADLVTTQVTLITTSKSQGINLHSPTPRVIVKAHYVVENTSEEPLESSRYLKFSTDTAGEWVYDGTATESEFYLHLFSIY